MNEIEEAARALPDSLATFIYADDPVVPLIHRLWKALERELPAMCSCSCCDPQHALRAGPQER